MQLTFPKNFKVSSEQFKQLVAANESMRLETTQSGELIVMPPTGGSAGRKNFNLYIDLGIWNRQTRLGVAFDSSTLFILPNGARRSPDVAWIKASRWQALTPEQQDGFPEIAPDFVIELVSPSDLTNQRYEDLQNKMQEYIVNGVKLGWLIEPKQKKVEIYRQGREVEVLNAPAILSGEDVLPGLILDLSQADLFI